jgi:protein SCO1
MMAVAIKSGNPARTGFQMSIAVALLLGISPAFAQLTMDPTADRLPPQLNDVGIEQKLNQQVPLELPFRDEEGRTVKLGEFFDTGKPVVLALVYFDCPMMCSQVLNSLATTLRRLKFDAGKQFEVLTVSFDAREQPKSAAAAKSKYLAAYNRVGAQQGWHFLTGDQPSIDALSKAVGFHFRWDARTQQFAHATGIMLLTPEGRVSRYYYGARYFASDLRLGLVEASRNQIGTLADQVVLYCYHYDPRTGRYGMIVFRALQISGGLTVVLLAGFVIFLLRTDPKRHARTAGGGFIRARMPANARFGNEKPKHAAMRGD